MALVVQAPTRVERPRRLDGAGTVRELAIDATVLNQPRPPPAMIGRYVIEAELGRGMMGVVYRAKDPVLDRKVALKVVELALPLREEERGLMEQRLLREARLAARLTHPNIVVVHDVGWDGETRRPFIALEYIEGRTLAEVLASGPAMDLSEALRLVSRLADALHYAHGHGIVHRDIKPANIMILPSGDPKIMDFGIAKASAAELTVMGECWGTPSYMSPEQASGDPMDGRTDLFSLGSVLYQLLTGRRPFEGKSVPQIVTRVVHHEPLLPSRIRPALPPDLDVVITRALAKHPDQRYPNGRAFAEDLQDVLNSRPLRERDGLKTVPVLDSTTSFLATDIVAAPALLGAHPQARSRRLGPGPRWAAGAALAIGLALLGFRFTTATQAPALAPASATVTAAAWSPLFTFTPLLPVPAPTASQPVPAPTASQPGGEPRAASARPRRSAAPVALSSPKPAAQEPSAVPTTPAAPLATAPLARLALSVQHGVKQGRLRVWIDERLVFESELASTEKKILVFKKRTGSLAEVFDVAPGERVVRVEVEADARRRTAGLSGAFESGKTRLLEVRVRSNVDLKWKS